MLTTTRRAAVATIVIVSGYATTTPGPEPYASFDTATNIAGSTLTNPAARIALDYADPAARELGSAERREYGSALLASLTGRMVTR